MTCSNSFLWLIAGLVLGYDVTLPVFFFVLAKKGEHHPLYLLLS